MDEVSVNRILRTIEGAWGRLGDERVVFYSRWLSGLQGDPAAIEAGVLRLAETEPRLPSVAQLRIALQGTVASTIVYGDHNPAVIGQMVASIREICMELGRQRDEDWRICVAGVFLQELDFAKIPGSADENGFHRDRAEAARRILDEQGNADHWIDEAYRVANEYRRMVAVSGIRRIIEKDPAYLETYLLRQGYLFTDEELAGFRAEVAT